MNYLLGALAGLVWGGAVSAVNYAILKSCIKKNSTAAVTGANLARNAVDIAALAAVFFLRKVLPFSYEAALIATAVALSGLTIIMTLKLSKKV